MNNRSYLLLFGVLLAGALTSCDKSIPPGPDDKGFDKIGMLEQYADSIILPRYQGMQQKIVGLQSASEIFMAAPSVSTQLQLKNAYRDAHLQYERIAAFQFGPAETVLLDLFANFSGGLDYDFNTAGELTGFSIDTFTIESNIALGVYNLSNLDRHTFYAQGFPAMNYLFFGPNAVEQFNNNPNGRITYVRDVTGRLKSLVDQVLVGWGTYRQEFVTNTKTNVGSPIGNIVNQLAYQLDLLKGPRIGWPFGKQSGGILFASKCEAYYAGMSVALAVENLSGLKELYTCAGSGKAMSDYLIALNRSALNDEVIAQFDIAIAKLQSIPDPLSDAFSAEPAKVEAAYKEIQKLLTLLKTDVASATGVQITFTDSDGD